MCIKVKEPATWGGDHYCPITTGCYISLSVWSDPLHGGKKVSPWPSLTVHHPPSTISVQGQNVHKWSMHVKSNARVQKSSSSFLGGKVQLLFMPLFPLYVLGFMYVGYIWTFWTHLDLRKWQRLGHTPHEQRGQAHAGLEGGKVASSLVHWVSPFHSIMSSSIAWCHDDMHVRVPASSS